MENLEVVMQALQGLGDQAFIVALIYVLHPYFDSLLVFICVVILFYGGYILYKKATKEEK